MYIVAKHASAEAWKYYFHEDPTVTGLHMSYAVAQTHTGRNMRVSEIYKDYKEAEVDCKKLNESNPSDYYAVCPVISE